MDGNFLVCIHSLKTQLERNLSYVIDVPRDHEKSNGEESGVTVSHHTWLPVNIPGWPAQGNYVWDTMEVTLSVATVCSCF